VRPIEGGGTLHQPQQSRRHSDDRLKTCQWKMATNKKKTLHEAVASGKTKKSREHGDGAAEESAQQRFTDCRKGESHAQYGSGISIRLNWRSWDEG